MSILYMWSDLLHTCKFCHLNLCLWISCVTIFSWNGIEVGKTSVALLMYDWSFSKIISYKSICPNDVVLCPLTSIEFSFLWTLNIRKIVSCSFKQRLDHQYWMFLFLFCCQMCTNILYKLIFSNFSTFFLSILLFVSIVMKSLVCDSSESICAICNTQLSIFKIWVFLGSFNSSE